MISVVAASCHPRPDLLKPSILAKDEKDVGAMLGGKTDSPNEGVLGILEGVEYLQIYGESMP